MDNARKEQGENIRRYIEQIGKRVSWVAQRLSITEAELEGVFTGQSQKFEEHMDSLTKLFRKEKNFFHPNHFVLPLSLTQIEEQSFLFQVSNLYHGEDKDAFMESMKILDNFMEMLDVLSSVQSNSHS